MENTENTVPVAFVNRTNAPVKLYGKQKVGIIQPLEHVSDIRHVQEAQMSPKNQAPAHQVDYRTKTTDMVTMDSPLWDDKKQAELGAQLNKYRDCFAKDSSELGLTDCIEHEIDVGNDAPVKVKQRRIPYAERKTHSKHIKNMLQTRVVRPSVSPYSSPGMLVTKTGEPDGRYVIDYRQLNKCTKKQVFPVPLISDLFECFSNKKYMSTLDAMSAYWQVPMKESNIEKTAFSSVDGHFEFLRMPYGLSNSGATFQRMINKVLAGLLNKSTIAYLDDVCVLSETWPEHLMHIEQALQRFRKYGLTCKPTKCKCAREALEYLGLKLTPQGLETTKSHVQRILDFLTPTNVSQVRAFLGMASYYRRFVQNFSKIAHPLNCLLLKGHHFRWTKECEEAFITLKKTHNGTVSHLR